MQEEATSRLNSLHAKAERTVLAGISLSKPDGSLWGPGIQIGQLSGAGVFRDRLTSPVGDGGLYEGEGTEFGD